MKKTALLVMAAGIGSRFGGGIKQLEPVGPSGEIIMDYSIHDALEAGFNKVIFVIRKDLDEDFRNIIGKRIEAFTEVAYAYQERDDLPAGFAVPEGRTKPWGTGQAVIAARNVISEPFCVINADDYYGKEGFRILHDELVRSEDGGPDGKQQISMAAFVLSHTLSDNGGVTRGVLNFDDHGVLTGISETKQIVRTQDGAGVETESGIKPLDGNSLVSMNMWGLQPSFVQILEKGFRTFLESGEGDPLKKEYLLPDIIDGMIASGEADVHVLRSNDEWFGVTYREDREAVRESIRKLVNEGIYTSPLKN
jgi:hypothetical protein